MNEKKAKFLKNLSDVFDISQESVFLSMTDDEKKILFSQSIDEIIKEMKILRTKDKLEDSFVIDEGDQRNKKLEYEVPNQDPSLATHDLEKNISQAGSSTVEDIIEITTKKKLELILPRPESENVSSDEPLPSQSSTGSVYSPIGRNYFIKNVRASVDIMTPEVVDAFDKCRISYRNTVHLIGTVSHALGFDIESLILNKSSFNKARAKVRQMKAEKLKLIFQDQDLPYLIVHWDGKIIPDRFSCKKIDRLVILVSVESTVKIIDVPGLESQTGLAMANSVYHALDDWGLIDLVEGICVDTTNANLGRKGGAATILEQMIDKDLLHIACRHHILELILGAAFSEKFPGTIGPNNPIFLRFRAEWDNMKDIKPENGLEKLEPQLKLQIPRIVKFINGYLEIQHPREDYKELLELCLQFLGVKDAFIPNRPGACHHARWMAKAIYTLKIYLMRKPFKLNLQQIDKFYSVSKFIVFVYIEAWYEAPIPIAAPKNDLKLVKALKNYSSIDAQISRTTIKKMKNHLWYLSPELCALSFFDDKVSWTSKRNMVAALTKETTYEDDYIPKKYEFDVSMEVFMQLDLDYFINRQTHHFFERFKLDTEFLRQDCSQWSKMKSYIESREKIKTLRVVNDCSERAVHLCQEYINVLTKDEEQKQYLITCVDEFNKEMTTMNKKTLVKKLKKS